MEFRYRAGERERNFNSTMNRYYSSSTSIAYFAEQRFNGGFDTGSLINGSTNIPGQYLLEKIRKERMREEMLAKEIARKRMLEEEILREMEDLQHFPVNVLEEVDYRFDQRLQRGFESPLSDSQIIRNDDGGNEGFGRFNESKRVEFYNVRPRIPSSREMPKISLDMRFPANKLCGSKRKATDANQKKLAKKECTNQKKLAMKECTNQKKLAKKEWNCSLCRVTATSKKALNRHIKGKKHKSKEARLMKTKATRSSNSNADSSVVEDCDKLYYEEKRITSIEDKLSENSVEEGISVMNSANGEAHKMGENHQFSEETAWWCKLCEVKCNSELMLQFHFRGKKHKARVETNDSRNGEVVLREKNIPQKRRRSR